jgi:uncharacterized protein YjiS (DUF1127 family)
MNGQHRSLGHAHAAHAESGVFPGLVGITEPLTELVSGALAALRGIRFSLRQRARRRHTLDALHRLDQRLLSDIGLERGDLIEAETRGLPIQDLARRRLSISKRRAGRLDAALESRRPAVNDESYRLVA